MLKRVGENRHPCRTPTVVPNPSLFVSTEQGCTLGLVIQTFNYSYDVGVDVVLPHSCRSGFVPCPVKDWLEVYGDMVEILLLLQVFLAEDPEIEYVFCLKNTFIPKF